MRIGKRRHRITHMGQLGGRAGISQCAIRPLCRADQDMRDTVSAGLPANDEAASAIVPSK